MSARERQQEIVQGMIQRSPIGMRLDTINQVGDTDTHQYTIGCGCGEAIEITLEQGQEGFWVMQTLNHIRSHVQLKHGEQMPVDDLA